MGDKLKQANKKWKHELKRRKKAQAKKSMQFEIDEKRHKHNQKRKAEARYIEDLL